MTGAVQTKGCFGRFSLVYSVAISYSLAAIGIGLGILIGTNKLMSKALDPSSSYCELYRPWLGYPLLWQPDKTNQQPFSWFYHRDMADFNQQQWGGETNSQDYNNVAKVLQLSRKEYFFNILIPGALPTFWAWELQLAWLAIIAAEMLCPHCWYWLFLSGKLIKITSSEVILALIYIGVVGLLLDKFMAWIETRIVPQEQGRH